MPFLALVHLRDLACAECGERLASAGARSFLVDDAGEAVGFAENEIPEEMTVEIRCARGHLTRLFVPNEIGAEEALVVPDDAPIAKDAIIVA